MRPRALLVLGTESGTWNEMFDSLSERLGGILDRLTRRGALTEADVDAALREVRRALLEADVALDVARAFIDQVKSHAVGIEVIQIGDARPNGSENRARPVDRHPRRARRAVDLNAAPPVPIMMVGLQGSGKTTTSAKLAKRLSEQARRKVLMASLDVRRPAAMEQLAVLGRRSNVETLPSPPASRRRRLRSAHCRPGGSAAMTSSSSIPLAAPRSMKR